MAFLVAFCVWFGCPDPPPPAHIHDVARSGSVSAPVAPDTHRGMGSDVEQWRGLVSAYFSDVDRALCVVKFESGGNPDALNPSGASGLFQVMPFWFDHFGGERFDPENNVRVAALVLAEQGWTAWSVVNKGLC